MKNLALISFLCFFLPACNLNGPVEDLNDNETLRLEAGAYVTAESSRSFIPYFEKKILIFKDSSEQEFSFTMNQIAHQPDFSYTSTFEHPDNPIRDVDYNYTGDRYEFEFLCTALGAKFEVLLRPNICTNPNLRSEGKVLDHLRIHALGFNSSDVLAPGPVLDITIPSQSICGEGKKYDQITLLGRDFEDVYYNQLTFAGRTIEVYYSPNLGIVAFRTAYMFAVLDQIF